MGKSFATGDSFGPNGVFTIEKPTSLVRFFSLEKIK